MPKIKHTPAYVPHAVTPTDSVLVEILNELRSIHEHLDAEEDAALAAEKKAVPETTTKRSTSGK